MKPRFVAVVALCVIFVALCPLSNVEAAELFGHATVNWRGGAGELYLIDTVAQTVSVVGIDAARVASGPDIAVDPAGTLYMSRSSANPMWLIDPATGLNTGTLPLSGYPATTNTATALDFMGPTLYASFSVSGPETGDGYLATIDTATGAITTIGQMTGMGRPAGGLEFVGPTLYTVAATDNNDSRLFTVDVATGATTLIGNMTLGGVQQETATGLAYADGTMYVVLSNGDTSLYSIDLATGVMTLEFDMGVAVVSLTPTAVPVPFMPHWALVLLLAAIAYVAYRRFSTVSQ